MNEQEKRDFLEKMANDDELLLRHIAKTMIEQEEREIDRLMQDDTIQVPDGALDWMLEAVDRQQKEERRKKIRNHCKHITAACAIVVALAVSSGAILYNTVEAFRWKVNSLFVQPGDGYFQLTPDDGGRKNTVSMELPFEIPEEFAVQNVVERINEKMWVCETENGKRMKIVQSEAAGSTMLLDTEGDSYGTVLLKEGIEGYWTSDGNLLTLTWLENDQLYRITGNITLEEIKEIVEN